MALIFVFMIMTSLTVLAERKYEIYDSKSEEKLSIQDFAKRSSKFDVIFFGEFHDDSIIHKIQSDFFSEFLKINPKTALSMEMFERDVQNILNDYLKGAITEEEFLKNSRPWPDYKKFYRPLVELAKENNLPVIAANIPRKYAALYASDGFDGIEKLPANERKYVTSSLTIDEDEYMQKFIETMTGNFGDKNKKLTPNQENLILLYYGAQLIKDETMAESIVNFIKSNSGYKVVHINGDFHSNNYLGTVQKVIERNKKLKVAVITPLYVEAGKEPQFDNSFRDKCDFLIVLEDKPRTPIPPTMMGGHLGENFAVKHQIDIKLKPSENFIEGTDTVTFRNPIVKSGSLTLIKDLKVHSVTSPETNLDFKVEKNEDDSLYNQIIIIKKEKEFRTVIVKYSGKLNYQPDVTLLNVRHSNTPGIISGKEGEGIYLPSSSFYPKTNKDLAEFNLKVSIPEEFSVITSGKELSNSISNGFKIYHFQSELPHDDIILVGGRYQRKDTIYDGKRFSTFTFGKSENVEKYLKASIDYYNYYTDLLGEYPYSSFSIVENFFATGFGMPSYTLLSNKLMAMPMILLSPGSLAHEFVHNWWGNSVYVDYEMGNWCEALTTFCTNYYYNVITKNVAGALDWRKKALISIVTLPEKSKYPVSKFKYQSVYDDATIGYQKGGFIFYEIMKLIGEKRFFDALKSFANKFKGKRAYWSNLTSAFDEQNKKDSLNMPIRKIMDQWLNDIDEPTLKLENVRLEKDSISFDIIQDKDFYLSIPVELITDKDSLKSYMILKTKQNSFKLRRPANLKSIRIDPNYEVLRKVYSWEIPTSFNQTLSDNPLVILPSKTSKEYSVLEEFAKLMIESDYKVEYKSVDDLKENDWQNRSLIVMGERKNNEFFSKLNGKYPKGINIKDTELEIDGKNYSAGQNIMLLNMGHPTSQGKFCSVIYNTNIDSINPLKRLFRYLSYSMVVIDKDVAGKSVTQKEIFPETGETNILRYDVR
ncbi:MAG: ChaN family lipoprotein [Candidatus Kapabacteria bacterium]|nr:ChaN family lipoprotein [Candidatus Kapabacteria bacterium]